MDSYDERHYVTPRVYRGSLHIPTPPTMLERCALFAGRVTLMLTKRVLAQRAKKRRPASCQSEPLEEAGQDPL